jgi:hypothetical protein
MSYESGKSTVTGTVTANIAQTSNNPPTLPAGATLVVKSARLTTNGVSTIHTVTAGKTLYIMSMWISGNAGSGDQMFLVTDAAGYGNLLAVESLGASGQQSIAINPNGLLSIPATKFVQLQCGGTGGHVHAGFTGYEL